MLIYLVIKETYEYGIYEIIGGYRKHEDALAFIEKEIKDKNIYRRFEDLVTVRNHPDDDYDEYTNPWDYKYYIIEQNIS